MNQRPPSESDSGIDKTLDAALKAMDAEELRKLIWALIPWLGDANYARLMNEAADRATQTCDWIPETLSETRVEAIEAFADAAELVGQAHPGDVDDWLRDGNYAFLAGDYAAAFRIFRALLVPVDRGDIDLGQHEMVESVLGVDVDQCVAQYAVSAYMLASPNDRAHAVYAALVEDVQSISSFREPLRNLEKTTSKPLPEFDEFMLHWHALLEDKVKAERVSWDRKEALWLREVVARREGPDGLAKLARRSRRGDDFRAWCAVLEEEEDWSALRLAAEEAATLVEDRAHCQGEFLDDAALAAQKLGAEDLPIALKRAWQGAPSFARLRRFLGASATREEFLAQARMALKSAPADAMRQRALLHVILGDFNAATMLLSNAPGLGWSSAEHPGHLLFPLFAGLLGGTKATLEFSGEGGNASGLAYDERPKLHMPTIEEILDLAETKLPDETSLRLSLVGAMRTAAEKRITGVTEEKRRARYSHAASLAVQCVQVDESQESWLIALMAKYRRYSALKREFKALGWTYGL